MHHQSKINIPVYISLGSNSDNALNSLEIALQEIKLHKKGRIGATSSIYQTEPQGDKDQNWFYNQLIRFDLDILDSQETKQTSEYKKLITNQAELLLDFLLNIEKKMGRNRDPLRRFGPRVIDLDIILFGTYCINTKILEVPHPRFLERAFVLIPLQEIDPSIIIAKNIKIIEALANISFKIDGNKIYQ